MSDPLSVCASVAGLVGISAKIASLAKKLYDSGKDVPTSISRIQAEMEQLHLIFVQVQMLLDGHVKKRPSRSRLSMLPLHHLMTILSGCVLAYSSLDKKLSEVAGLAPKSAAGPESMDAGTLLVHRVKWILWKEDEAKVILADLERHKSSLHIMLTIIQGNFATESVTEAATETAESLKRLHDLVERISQQISQSYPEAATQLRELISEHRNGSFDISISPTEDSSSSIAASITDYDFNDNASIRTTASSLSIRTVCSRILPFAEELKSSRPYKRLLRRGIDHSSSSVFSKDSQSTTRGDTWTMLSDMSLGDLSISEISVLELPIYLSDLYDPIPYQHSSSKKEGRQVFKFSSSRGRLHAAIRKQNLFMFRTYLALGADPEEMDADGCPLLVYAMKRVNSFDFDSRIIQLLLDRGVVIDCTDSNGRTSLSHAAEQQDLRICQKLLDRGAIVNSTDANGRTPLSYAAEQGRPATCDLLLDGGAIVDSTDSNGRTPSSYAAEQGNSESCKALLDRGAIVDSTDSNGRTPLSYAAQHGEYYICELLVSRGAIVDSADSNGRTPLSYAAEHGKSLTCKFLLDKGADRFSDTYIAHWLQLPSGN